MCANRERAKHWFHFTERKTVCNWKAEKLRKFPFFLFVHIKFSLFIFSLALLPDIQSCFALHVCACVCPGSMNGRDVTTFMALTASLSLVISRFGILALLGILSSRDSTSWCEKLSTMFRCICHQVNSSQRVFQSSKSMVWGMRMNEMKLLLFPLERVPLISSSAGFTRFLLFAQGSNALLGFLRS